MSKCRACPLSRRRINGSIAESIVLGGWFRFAEQGSSNQFTLANILWCGWHDAMRWMVWQRTKNNHGRRWQCNIPIQNVNLPSQLPIRDYLAKREQQQHMQHQGYSPILICTSHCESTRPRAVFADAKQCVTECNLEYFKFWGKLITDLLFMEINDWE